MENILSTFVISLIAFSIVAFVDYKLGGKK